MAPIPLVMGRVTEEDTTLIEELVLVMAERFRQHVHPKIRR